MSIHSVYGDRGEEEFAVGLSDGSFEIFKNRVEEPIYRYPGSNSARGVTGQLSLWQMRYDFACWLGYNASSESLVLFGIDDMYSYLLPVVEYLENGKPVPELDARLRCPGLGQQCAFSWEPEDWKISGTVGRGLVDCLGILVALGECSRASHDDPQRYFPVAYLVMKHQEFRGSVSELRIERAPLSKELSAIEIPRGLSIVSVQSVRADAWRDTAWPFCTHIKDTRTTAHGSENTFWTCDDIVLLSILSNGDIVLSSSEPGAQDAVIERLQQMPGLRLRGR